MKRLSFWLFCLAFCLIWASIFVNTLMLSDSRSSFQHDSVQENGGDQGAMSESNSDQAANAIQEVVVDWLVVDRNRGKQIRLAASTAAILPSFSHPWQPSRAHVALSADEASSDDSLIAQHVRLQI